MGAYMAKEENLRSAIIRIACASVSATLLALGFSAVINPASAQAVTVCSTHAEVTKRLDKRLAQAPVAVGLANGGRVIEVFSSEDGDTWTIVLTQPNGKTCLVANGEAWLSLPMKLRGPGA